MRFYIVDVFALRKYTGNQLAVFKDAENLSAREMQEIAREMNYSETTFIISDEYEVRIFTPEREIEFAGHPILGTAFVIKQEMNKNAEMLVLKPKIGEIAVRAENDVLWMKQMPPRFGDVLSANEISKVLKIEEEEIDRKYPIREVSTGLPFIIVPLKRLESLKRVKVDREEYFKLIENTTAKAILTFCPETYEKENHLSVRVFAEYYGVVEDPATGSANGCLAGYLTRYKYFGKGEIDIRVEQGYEIGRLSLLFLRAKGSDIEVGGKVIMVARGEFI